MKREYWYGLMLAFIVLIGVMTYDFHVTHKLIEQARTEILEVHDTLVKYRTDTIFHKTPIYVKQTVLKRDTVQVWRPYEQDSVQVEIPYIQKEFKDSLYEAWVSGYQEVNLDSIRIFKEKQIIEINKTKYITKYKVKPFGFSIGVGGTYSPVSNKIEPGVFLGITYTIKSFGKRK